jgi:glucose/arabinose dehydrogenase
MSTSVQVFPRLLAPFLTVLLATACEAAPPNGNNGNTVEPPTIASFTAEPPVIALGESSELSWTVADANQLRLDPGETDVSDLASLEVSPTATTLYMLTAVNPAGTAEAETELRVEEAPGPLVLEAVEIARDLPLPTSIKSAGDGTDRLFVTLQEGQIRVLEDDQLLPEPFLDVSQLVSCCGERGLLDVAFHPSYGENGLFFVNYTDVEGHTVVARYRVSDDPNRADADSAEIVFRVEQPFGNHNGGQTKFGPDGYLYIALGDGGAGGDPQNHGQNTMTLLGSLLRIDVDGGEPYLVPEDNPFVGVENAHDEIWAYGLRNPWRFSFDRESGDLWIADVGQNTREEVNVQPASSPGGENYGWNIMEGSLCFPPGSDCDPSGLVLPVLEYETGENCAVTGGYRYRGEDIPALEGAYLYGDYCSGRIWGASQENGAWSSEELLHTSLRITSFGEDERGEIYLANHGGTVHRLVAR